MADVNDYQWQTIDAEILAHRMISAIKNYRMATGAGLKEAKDAVEARQQFLLSALPGQFGAPDANETGLTESAAKDWEEFDAELFAGRKIQAIKLYRRVSGLGLKEAKDVIEAREKQLRDSSPERFTAVAKTGCMSVLLLSACITVLIFLFK